MTDTQIVGGVSDSSAVGNAGTTGMTDGGQAEVRVGHPSPTGWYGSLSAWRLFGSWDVALRPLGFAVRTDDVLFGLSAGAGFATGALQWGTSSAFDAIASLAARVEIPNDTARVAFFADVDNSLHSGGGAQTTFVIGGSLQLTPAWSYSREMRAGVGPVIVAGNVCAWVRDPDGGSATCTDFHAGYFLLAGLELYRR